MQMVKDRDLAAHTYNETLVERLCAEIAQVYLGLFVELKSRFQVLAHNEP
jgi:hypothetical protein